MSAIPTTKIFVLKIGGVEVEYQKMHYVKNHPTSDPDIFDILLDGPEGATVDYFDPVEIYKNNVLEFYGFVEDIIPIVDDSGLIYQIGGRCWKLILWKKYTERYVETREVGVNNESGFFGEIYPHELLLFLLRTPVSIHPLGKVRQRIGWGIPSDNWTCAASGTANARHPSWVATRLAGLSWQLNGFQTVGSWFKVDLGETYNRVTAVMIEDRNDTTKSRFARHFDIQLSKDNITWVTVRSFAFYNARDCIASFAPYNNVRYIRVWVTKNYNVVWEISQIYVWQTDVLKYRILNEAETDL
jgi:hypothetical protein